MLRQIITQAKKHPSLIPLFVFIGAGGTGAALYVTRLALFNPDVCWDRKNNPEPWNKLGPNDQYKHVEDLMLSLEWLRLLLMPGFIPGLGTYTCCGCGQKKKKKKKKNYGTWLTKEG
ncbi:cytochrome c oxidase subunit NDUFA4 isoform X1 [Sus scrofa]|uniref:cytochrome c oxidase subunit NDUFA4 isoform X1 n=1 Tax=Sus scrofa TaxID=9823 RepID=UPI0003AF0D90|nr:cytochrome c oxidase subunit NDUFA4 isoform X1 [Sus scrofa]